MPLNERPSFNTAATKVNFSLHEFEPSYVPQVGLSPFEVSANQVHPGTTIFSVHEVGGMGSDEILDLVKGIDDRALVDMPQEVLDKINAGEIEHIFQTDPSKAGGFNNLPLEEQERLMAEGKGSIYFRDKEGRTARFKLPEVASGDAGWNSNKGGQIFMDQTIYGSEDDVRSLSVINKLNSDRRKGVNPYYEVAEDLTEEVDNPTYLEDLLHGKKPTVVRGAVSTTDTTETIKGTFNQPKNPLPSAGESGAAASNPPPAGETVNETPPPKNTGPAGEAGAAASSPPPAGEPVKETPPPKNAGPAGEAGAAASNPPPTGESSNTTPPPRNTAAEAERRGRVNVGKPVESFGDPLDEPGASGRPKATVTNNGQTSGSTGANSGSPKSGSRGKSGRMGKGGAKGGSRGSNATKRGLSNSSNASAAVASGAKGSNNLRLAAIGAAVGLGAYGVNKYRNDQIDELEYQKRIEMSRRMEEQRRYG